MQTIELDCPPGNPRPGDLLPAVIEGTGLTVRDPDSKFMGCWVFNYADVPADQWETAKPTLKQRITALYESGVIRYGSW